jgi:hypothetical protein
MIPAPPFLIESETRAGVAPWVEHTNLLSLQTGGAG